MTDARLAELERLASMATPPPWKWQDWYHYGDPDKGPNPQTLVGPLRPPGEYGPANVRIVSFEEPPENPADAAFIPAAREALPELLQEVRRLRAIATRLDAAAGAPQPVEPSPATDSPSSS